jgi:hypothetical protein
MAAAFSRHPVLTVVMAVLILGAAIFVSLVAVRAGSSTYIPSPLPITQAPARTP